MTNKGLHITIPVLHRQGESLEHIAILSCHEGDLSEFIGIVLEPAEREGAGVYLRRNASPIFINVSSGRKAKTKSIYILKEIRSISISESKYAWIRSLPPERYGLKIDDFATLIPGVKVRWNKSARTLSLTLPRPSSKCGGLIFKHKNHPAVVVSFGCLYFGHTTLVIDISKLRSDQSASEILDNLWKKGYLDFSRQSWPRKLLTAERLLRWGPSHTVRYMWRVWSKKLRPWGKSRTASLDITSTRTISAAVTSQILMDEEIFVVDIEVRDTLLQEIRYLGPEFESFYRVLDFVSVNSMWLSYVVCYCILFAASFAFLSSLLALFGFVSFSSVCISDNVLQQNQKRNTLANMPLWKLWSFVIVELVFLLTL